MRERENQSCLDVVFAMARTGTYKNYLEVEQALSVSEAGCWDERLTEPHVRRQIDKLCTEARTSQPAPRRMDRGHLQG